MTYKHITINRIPVALELAMDDNHNAAVQREERLANTAPELLECLLDVLDADGDLYAMDFNRYRAAIEKATGKVTEDKT